MTEFFFVNILPQNHYRYHPNLTRCKNAIVRISFVVEKITIFRSFIIIIIIIIVFLFIDFMIIISAVPIALPIRKHSITIFQIIDPKYTRFHDISVWVFPPNQATQIILRYFHSLFQIKSKGFISKAIN